MKKLSVFALCAALALPAICAPAVEVRQLDKPADWITTPTKTITAKEGVLSLNGSTRLLSFRTIPVDPAKTYDLSVDIRQASGLPRRVFVGFSPLDAKGNPISCAHVSAKKGTDTILTKAVKKGDKVIWIKAQKYWNPQYDVVKRNNVIVWNTKADYSDLPNRNTCYADVVKAETVKDEMKITLSKPFSTTLPAGTAIRCHSDGGFMYTAGYGIPGKGDFKQFAGTVKGMSKVGFTYDQWPVGTKRCRILLLLNWGGKADAVIEFRNAKLTIK